MTRMRHGGKPSDLFPPPCLIPQQAGNLYGKFRSGRVLAGCSGEKSPETPYKERKME